MSPAVRKPLRYYFPDYTFLIAISGLVLFLDQLTKTLVRTRLDLASFWVPIEGLARYVRIVHWKNTGAAFGIFQDASLLFTILAIIVTLGILNFFPIIPRADRYLRAAVALQLGGAMGNLVDRLLLGHVTDFISVLNLPVFNIADASIFVGVILILIPILPQLQDEYAASQMMRSAREVNAEKRMLPAVETDEQELLTLGLVEVLFEDTEFVREFRLNQEVRRIRQNRDSITKGKSRG
jgi:signal peptidase II